MTFEIIKLRLSCPSCGKINFQLLETSTDVFNLKKLSIRDNSCWGFKKHIKNMKMQIFH